MKTELLLQLEEADEIDIIELTKALELAAWVRAIEKENARSSIEMAKGLGISLQLYKSMKNGCYAFNLRTIAKIQNLESSLTARMNKRKKHLLLLVVVIIQSS